MTPLSRWWQASQNHTEAWLEFAVGLTIAWLIMEVMQ